MHPVEKSWGDVIPGMARARACNKWPTRELTSTKHALKSVPVAQTACQLYAVMCELVIHSLRLLMNEILKACVSAGVGGERKTISIVPGPDRSCAGVKQNPIFIVPSCCGADAGGSPNSSVPERCRDTEEAKAGKGGAADSGGREEGDEEGEEEESRGVGGHGRGREGEGEREVKTLTVISCNCCKRPLRSIDKVVRELVTLGGEEAIFPHTRSI